MSLIVKNLSKKYGEKTVVDNLSFEMKDHGVYALLGTNGAGKTTAIRMILGMLAKDNGQVEWNGKPLDISTCNIGYLAEERGLYPKYTLMDQLMYFASLRGVNKTDAMARIKNLSKKLEADEYLFPNAKTPAEPMLNQAGMRRGMAIWKKEKPKLADQLSKGNQQKIQFMISLISDPELIILDEPLSGLDPVNTDIFKRVIQEQIERGKYVIMSSHQMATVEEFCTDITILNRSKTILQGHLNDIKKSYGRVNLFIKTEGDISELINASGAALLSRKENEYRVKVTGEDMANRLLYSVISGGITVVKFDLSEPTMHDIFVEKVGESNEADKE